MRETIIETMRSRGEIKFTDLAKTVNKELYGKFEGSITWYVNTVKLDLEARKVIERVPKTNPLRLRLLGSWREQGKDIERLYDQRHGLQS